MLSVLFLALMIQVPAAPAWGKERCAADAGPEVGVGILCDRARIALESRELSVADSLSQTATKLAPSHPGVWIVRAEVARKGRRIDEARQHLEKAAELEPQNPAILVIMGDFEAEEGNVRGAAVLYEQAFELAPLFPGLADRLQAIGDDPVANEI